MKELRERKYLALLTVLIVAAVLEPLAADWSERSRIFAGGDCRRGCPRSAPGRLRATVGAVVGAFPSNPHARKQYHA